MQPYSTGAVTVFAGLASGTGGRSPGPLTSANATAGKTPFVLGTCETAPDPDVVAEYAPIRNDLAGPTLPAFNMYVGQSGTLTLNMTMWNETVANRLRQFIDRGSGSLAPGTDRAIDRGTILELEGFAFPLWLRYERRNVAAMTSRGMARGRRFPFVHSMRVIDHPGNRPNAKTLILNLHSALLSSGEFLMEDADISAVENLDLGILA